MKINTKKKPQGWVPPLENIEYIPPDWVVDKVDVAELAATVKERFVSYGGHTYGNVAGFCGCSECIHERVELFTGAYQRAEQLTCNNNYANRGYCEKHYHFYHFKSSCPECQEHESNGRMIYRIDPNAFMPRVGGITE